MDLCHCIITHYPLSQFHLLCGAFALRMGGNLWYSERSICHPMLMKSSFIPEYLHFFFFLYSTPSPSIYHHQGMRYYLCGTFYILSLLRCVDARTQAGTHTHTQREREPFVLNQKNQIWSSKG